MPRSNKQMIKNLQRAINEKFNQRLLIDRQQWYSDEQQRPITLWKIKTALPPEERVGSKKYVELFSTMSEIQIVLFLRDYWYKMNGWKIPTDNPVWEEAKANYANKSTPKNSNKVNVSVTKNSGGGDEKEMVNNGNK